MKFIGHVSTAVIAATPIIYYRNHFPEAFQSEHLSDYRLIFWTAFWGVLPDIDIILQRYLPIKHRGFMTHSLFAALMPVGLVLAWYFCALKGMVPEMAFINPLTAILAFVGSFMHVIGDSITKTGVPLLWPNKKWNFPVIGGYACFDNYFLNAIPLAVAGFLMHKTFGWDPSMLKGLGKFRNYKEFLK